MNAMEETRQVVVESAGGPTERADASSDSVPKSREVSSILQETVWRCISARRRYGHWEYLYWDYVIESHIQEYMTEINKRGAERVSMHRFGTLDYALANAWHEPRDHPSLKDELKLRKLEGFDRV